MLFLGAGVSFGAGMPLWGQLLCDLAEKAGMTDNEIKALGQLSFLDQARLLENRLGGYELFSDLFIYFYLL